jgi:hypothetical protein
MEVLEVANIHKIVGDLKRGRGVESFEACLLEWVCTNWSI